MTIDVVQNNLPRKEFELIRDDSNPCEGKISGELLRLRLDFDVLINVSCIDVLSKV